MNPVNPPALRAVSLAAAVLGAAALGGCSSTESFLSGDKIDYKSQAQRTSPLDVPPDLTQLARDSRYQPQQGTVSASAMAAAAAPGLTPAAAAGQAVAPSAVGDVQMQRAGNQRWLKTNLKPEQLWPQLRAFWQERGFVVATDSAETGVMETDWAENRSKLPQDGIRKMLGGMLSSLYDTGERDRFRTRVERVADGTEVYITHRGMEEVLQGQAKDQTTWRPRAADPQLEAEMLARLMLKLGAKEEAVRTSVAGAAPAAAPVRARALVGQPGAALEVDEAFDRAWRRVGVTLDRSGFTVEDRDRNAGLYYVRYVDPKLAGKEEPGFFSRLFGGGDSKASAGLGRYRINVKAVGDKSQVSVQDNQGAADKGAVAQRIVSLLVEDLK